MTGDADDVAPTSPIPEFDPAWFPVELGLPPVASSPFEDARLAVRQEFRDCTKWKRLRCRKVSVIAERDRGTVYAVHVGSAIEFDWTWEGAVAFRPHGLPDEDDAFIDMADFEESPVDEGAQWSGQVIEVDERNGCLFLSLSNPECPPVVGSFFVRPYDFLRTLDSVFHEPFFQPLHDELGRRLVAAAGGVHPRIEGVGRVGLSHLREWWGHSWCVLWGPPGTGKTRTTGEQIAAVLEDQGERILVVSTTNRATDAVALSVGMAFKRRSADASVDGKILRIGNGASYQSFKEACLEDMLRGTEAETLIQIDGLAEQSRRCDSWEERALTKKKIAELRSGVGGQTKLAFLDPDVRVVIATAFKAMAFLDDETVRRIVEAGEAPFTTIFVDEAGLISRAGVAALSLLASRRVVLAGDSKQLAPISRMSRVMPTRQMNWLASSGVSHLERVDDTNPAVHMLKCQWRMHPEICRVVSAYQYNNLLTTAPETAERLSILPLLFTGESRAIWCVLDEEGGNLSSIRAERGPGNRSWVRAITPDILEKLFHDPAMRECRGVFMSPFKAQAQLVARWFASEGLESWQSSTVHSQQGSEADFVVFDTVNAGNCSWPYDEWRRLINVALSRAKEVAVLLASRAEMNEPHLRPLIASLTPKILVKQGGQVRWAPAEAIVSYAPPPETLASKNLGGQIAMRKLMRPILSREQQRLSNLELDGKPRLVRGVAGSGKTVVLSNWLARTVRRLPDASDSRIWAVYSNRSLHRLLRESIEAAWADSGNASEFPWTKVALMHIKDVLAGLLPSVSLSIAAFGFEYDRAAEEFLNRQDEVTLLPRCDALFIDEAQDMGPHTLRLLLSLVEQADRTDRNSRSAHIFFDNAQNIYGRKTPKWSEFGLDMRGRSSIMRESFRSTQPITEFAVNLLYRLSAEGTNADHKELISLGLVKETRRLGAKWLRVSFNQTQGIKPFYRRFDDRKAEMRALGDHLLHLLQRDCVSPTDICLIYNGKSVVQLLEREIAPRLAAVGVELSIQTNRSFERQPNTLLVTTSHSYKGYESEIVLIPCADQYSTQEGQVLASNLYVAMTRARSVLGVYSTNGPDAAVRQLNEALEHCLHFRRFHRIAVN